MHGHHLSTATVAAPVFVPTIRLHIERILIASDPLAPGYEEAELPVLELSFDYEGTRIRASG